MTAPDTCRHCGRRIVSDPEDGWVDPEATGDDRVWRETCDAHDTFEARHEPEDPEDAEPCLTITVSHRADGSLVTVVRFDSGERLTAEAGDPDLGFTEANNVLHDVAHTLLACRLGLSRSPVLERVVNLRPLSQTAVDLEEAATFALQAWCASLRGEDHLPAVNNARASLDRLHGA